MKHTLSSAPAARPLGGRRAAQRLACLLLCLALLSPLLPARAVDGTAEDIQASFSGAGLAFERIKDKLQEAIPGVLNYITDLHVDTDQGTIYDGYVAESDTGAGVSHHQRYYASGNGLYMIDNLTFVPKPDFGGTAEITYTAFNSTGTSFGGTIYVSVDQQASLMSFTSPDAGPIHFSSYDFTLYCQLITHRALRYVTFSLPSSTYGKLYYQYVSSEFYGSPVDPTVRYYPNSSPSLGDVTFVPRRGYSGDFYINFTMCDVSGNLREGRAAVHVDLGNTVGGLLYHVEPGGRVDFQVSDFSTASMERTGSALNYIRFASLPPASQGVLNCSGRSGVNTTEAYYVSGNSARIGDLSFTASNAYTGTVSIPFMGITSQGGSFRAEVQIEISALDSAAFDYTVSSGQRIYLRIPELYTACMERTGYPLESLRFTTLPSASDGVLYYMDTQRISAGSTYYYSGGTNLLEHVSFVASDVGSGRISVPFTATSTGGQSFAGRLLIEIRDDGSAALSYVVYSGQRLQLSAPDLVQLCYQKTGDEISSIRFTSLPDASRGILYYGDTDTRANTATFYYYVPSGNSRSMEPLFFLPTGNFSGNVTLPFTARSRGGESFNGELRVSVIGTDSGSGSSSISYRSDGTAVRLRTEDFTAAAHVLLSDVLTTVRLTNPDATVGTLYARYASPLDNKPLRAGTELKPEELDSVVFVPKALTSGSVHIAYTLLDQSGNSASSSLSVEINLPTASSYFGDMAQYAWAVPSVDFLRANDIVTGVTDQSYGPAVQMRRGDFVLMLSRCFKLPQAGRSSFADVPQDRYYAEAIASAKAAGVLTGSGTENFYPDAAITRRDAAVFLHRCMTYTGTVVSGSADDLVSFSDRTLIPAYAEAPMGALVRRGILVGDGSGHINPNAILNRAEMSVILHKAIT